jgi:ribulose 1,5-bisphosphate carboxylase large subunit-like protein
MDLLAHPDRAAAIARAGRAAFEADFARAPVLAAWRMFLEAAARIRS